MREFTMIGGPCDGQTTPYSERIEREGEATIQIFHSDHTPFGGHHVYRVEGNCLIYDPRATAERRAAATH